MSATITTPNSSSSWRLALAEGEETEIEAPHEQGEPQQDHGQSHQCPAEIRKGLAQHRGLEDGDHDNDEKDVPGAAHNEAQHRSEPGHDGGRSPFLQFPVANTTDPVRIGARLADSCCGSTCPRAPGHASFLERQLAR
jgi:hypothetical protein